MKIVPLSKSDAAIIAQIHLKALKGDFLPLLGLNFLKTFYEGIIDKKDIYGFVCEEMGKIAGFAIGTKDFKSFFKEAIKANFLKLSFLLFMQIFKQPKIVKNIAETFLYQNKDKGPKAELVVIAVDNKLQGKGIGKKLILELEKAFRKNKISRYKLTVHADKKAVGFYEHLMFSHISKFRLYDKMWSVYEKNLST